MKANDIRVGNVLEHKNSLWMVTKTQHTMPGKGGAFMQVEMKDIQSGTKLNERFRSTETVSRARLDESEYQFLFADGDTLTFMDNTSYEQIALSAELLDENQRPYLEEGMTVSILSHEETPLMVKLPDQVTLTVEDTEAVVKGQTAASSNKPATLSNGVRVMVPPFVDRGDDIIVNTNDNSYVERAKA